MSAQTLILGWGGEDAQVAIEYLRNVAAGVDLIYGGEMAPGLLAHLEWHERVLLLGSVAWGGKTGEVLRLNGNDLEKLCPHAAWHEAVRQVELSERQAHAFVAIVTERGEGAAAALAGAARRQLVKWSEPARRI